MVNDQASPDAGDVRSLLCQIIAEHGIDVIGDRDRIRASLHESPESAPRETLALAEAAGLGIPAELRAQDAAATVPMAVVAERLARRLQQDAGLADDVSRWAVATWAGVLGIGGVPDAVAGAGVPDAAADTGPGHPGVAEGFTAPAMASPVVAPFGFPWVWGSYLAWRRASLIAAAVVIVIVSLIVVLINNSITLLPGFGSQSNSLSTTCTVGRDSQGAPGWVVKFTNTTSSDVTVSDFTILFFASSGTQTGSLDSVSVVTGGFTVAANNSYMASNGGFPLYSTTCRVTDLVTY